MLHECSRHFAIDINRSVFSSYFSANMVDKIQVLDKFQPFLYILLIYHPKKVQNNFAHFIQDTFEKIVLTLLIIATWIFIISATWFSIDERFKWEVVAQPFSIMLGGLSMKLIYILMIANGKQIEAIIDFLQRLVEARKLFLRATKENIFSSYFWIIFIGCGHSEGVFSIYNKMEEFLAFIGVILSRIAVGTTTFLVAATIATLCSFAIFQHPQPENWFLPFGYR